MAYLGNKPVNNFVSFAKQDITGNGGTSYTLDYPVTGQNDIELFINNVRQEPTEAYSCSGTTLTLTEAVQSTDDIYAIFRGRAIQTATHPSDLAISASGGTFSGDISFGDSDKAKFGASNDLEVYHNGSASVINDTGQGDLYVGSDSNVLFTNSALNSVKMALDSSGNLLVGRTSVGATGAGHSIRGADSVVFSRDAGEALILNRDTSDGTITQFRKDGSTKGAISYTGSHLTFYSSTGYTGIGGDATSPQYWLYSGAIYPTADNTRDLGTSGNRFDDVYATNGSIQTSDINEKQDIEELSDAEQRVAVACKGLLRKFRWKDAVAEKGEAARTHFGIIAQDLQAAFEAEGLDAGDYAMFISTTWWETQTEVPSVEADEEKGIEAKDAYTRTDTFDTAEEAPEGATERTRLGVRYSELLAFIIAAI